MLLSLTEQPLLGKVAVESTFAVGMDLPRSPRVHRVRNVYVQFAKIAHRAIRFVSAQHLGYRKSMNIATPLVPFCSFPSHTPVYDVTLKQDHHTSSSPCSLAASSSPRRTCANSAICSSFLRAVSALRMKVAPQGVAKRLLRSSAAVPLCRFVAARNHWCSYYWYRCHYSSLPCSQQTSLQRKTWLARWRRPSSSRSCCGHLLLKV